MAEGRVGRPGTRRTRRAARMSKVLAVGIPVATLILGVAVGATGQRTGRHHQDRDGRGARPDGERSAGGCPWSDGDGEFPPWVDTVIRTPQSCLDALAVANQAFTIAATGLGDVGKLLTATANLDMPVMFAASNAMTAEGNKMPPLADRDGGLSAACTAGK